MSDAYVWYCEWCRDHGQAAPTREWWDRAVAQPRKVRPPQSDIDFDRETERREGWAYD
jgi:hypothetical protein